MDGRGIGNMIPLMKEKEKSSKTCKKCRKKYYGRGSSQYCFEHKPT